MDRLPLWVLVTMFALGAAAVWAAGSRLSDQTDVLASRLHLGSALGGLIFLAIATNLPEIAIVASASLSGNLGVAVGNILGGIAIQTVVLVALDGFGVTGSRPLTYRAASLVLVLEAALVVAVLGIVVAGTQLPRSLIALRLTPAPVLILVVWVAGLVVLKRARRRLPWHNSGQPPDGQQAAGTRDAAQVRRRERRHRITTAASAGVFAVAAAVTLLAGVVLERSGEMIADRIGLSGVLFGATFLAAATALPELSTGISSVRNGDYQLAVSDIFGGNAFLPVLFVLATLLSGRAVLPQAGHTDIYLTALAIVLTAVYGAGLLLRPRRRIARLGADSLIVLTLYIAGIGGLFAIAGA